jgi:acyl dehydratase
MDEPLYLEDLKEGQTFKSGSYALTAEEIKSFARRYDPQPFHSDEQAAEHTFFKGLVARGWHTVSVTMRLMVESTPIAGGLIGEWLKPVRPGDTLTVVTEVLGTRASQSKPGLGLVRIRSTTLNQHQETVQVFISTIVVPRRLGKP